MKRQMQIKLNLLKIKRARRLSQTELSKMTGISRNYLSELETGRHNNPSIKTLCKIAIGLNCTLEDLVDYRGGCECESSDADKKSY